MHHLTLLPIQRFIMASIFAFCALLIVPGHLFSQICGGAGNPRDITNLGTDFLMCFMQNEAPNSDATGAKYQDIYLASAGDTATVTITCKAFPKLKKVFFLKKDEAFVYHISNDPFVTDGDATMELDELIDPTVIKVNSTTPIACYGMNNKQFTADAFLALPRSVASTEYRVMAYYNSLQGGANMPSEFAVAAFDSNTTVRIWPSVTTQQGNEPDPVNPLVYVLNGGEGVQIHADPNTPLLDLTGSIVESDKPIVVYGGSQRTEVPIGYFFDESGGSRITRDHLCEQIPPTSTWGYSFIAKNFGRILGDFVRVLASTDNTVVKINGQVWGAPLMKNKFRDYVFDLSDTAEKNIISVESDQQHTILVGMIAHSGPDIPCTGDPFLAIVPPVNQTFNDYTYFITDDGTNYDLNQQYLIIATEKSGIGKISIDGAVIPDTIKNLPGVHVYKKLPNLLNGKQYAALTLNQTSGVHHIVSPNLPEDGFTILAYGWGDRISYGYTAGGLFKPTHGIMQKNLPDRGFAPGQDDKTPILPPPSITVRNIIMEKVYFDSARVRYSQNPHNISVRLKKDIAMETGTIEVAQEKTLELTTSEPVQDAITGTIRIWYHSRMWTDMYPVDFPFTILPQPAADVKGGAEQAVLFENYPNPVVGNTTIHFVLPQRASVSLKIFDALGRNVRTVVQSPVNSGDQTYQVNTKALTPGEYTLELLAPELGINEHRKMVVIE